MLNYKNENKLYYIQILNSYIYIHTHTHLFKCEMVVIMDMKIFKINN